MHMARERKTIQAIPSYIICHASCISMACKKDARPTRTSTRIGKICHVKPYVEHLVSSRPVHRSTQHTVKTYPCAFEQRRPCHEHDNQIDWEEMQTPQTEDSKYQNFGIQVTCLRQVMSVDFPALLEDRHAAETGQQSPEPGSVALEEPQPLLPPALRFLRSCRRAAIHLRWLHIQRDVLHGSGHLQAQNHI